jgi:hypothetical protein
VQALREAPTSLAGDIPCNGEAHRRPSAAGVLPGGGIAIDRHDPVSLRNAHHRSKRGGHHRLFISLPSDEVSELIEHAADHPRIDIHHQMEVVDIIDLVEAVLQASIGQEVGAVPQYGPPSSLSDLADHMTQWV